MKKTILFFIFVVFTASLAFGQALSEDFENGGSIPTGWTNEYLSATVDWTFETGGHSGYPSGAHGGTYNALFYSGNYGNDQTRLVTPVMDLSAVTNPVLTFWHTQDDWGGDQDELRVYYKTSAGGSWTLITGQEYTTNISSWTEEADIALPTPNSTYYIAFDAISGYGYGVCIDDVLVEEGPSCPAPSALTTTSITQTTADLNWTEAGSATTWQVEWMLTGVVQGSGTTITNIGSHPYTLNPPLSASTIYDWYVRADCGGGNYSNWSGPATFTTACGTITVPWIEGFATWPPTCWDLTGGTHSWIHYAATPCAEASFYAQGSGSTDYMTSPTLDISGLSNPALDFDWSHKYSSYYPNDALEVLVSDDGGTNWTQVWYKAGTDLDSADGATNGAPGTFVNSGYLSLSAFGNTIIVRFLGISGWGPDLFVDNVNVDEEPSGPPNCATNPNPGDLDTNVQLDANLSWSAGGGATPTGYKIYFGTDDPPTNIENGTDLGLVTTYDPTSNMASSIDHYWKIVPYNTSGNATGCSVWSFRTQDDPNYGGGGTAQGGYYFANSLATGAPSQPSYSWIDFSGHTVVPIDPTMSGNKDGFLSDDDYEGPFPIGFSFSYFNSTFTEFYIQSNGLISFTDDEYGYDVAIPTDGGATDIIAWCWRDMDADDPDITDTDVRYSSGAAQCVITFWHYPEYGASAGEYVTSQVILYPNGNVKIQYNDLESDINGTADFPSTCTIGVEGDNVGVAYGIEYRRDGSGGPMFGSDLAVMFGTDDGALPVELTSFTAIVVQNEFISINWTTQSECNMVGYKIYRSESDLASADFVSEIINAVNTTEPHDYIFNDEEVEINVTYNYWLEGIEYDSTTNLWGPISATMEGEIIPELPQYTILYRNYPNPFNPTTLINFDIQEGETAELTIFNIKGQVVKSMKLGEGRHSIEWDAKSIASGVYFYKLKSESYTEIKKMMLLK